MTAQYFDILQLFAMAGFLSLFIGRTLQLSARGIRVMTLVRGKPWPEAALEALFLVAFPLWLLDIVWLAWPGTTGTSVLDPALFDPSWARSLGAALQVSAIAMFAWSLVSFGNSWRVGVDRGAPGQLVTTGIFGWSRNPIFLSMDLFLVGAALLTGRLLPTLFAAVAMVGFHRQIRAEESFLRESYGPAYRAYCDRVRRYAGRRAQGAELEHEPAAR